MEIPLLKDIIIIFCLAVCVLLVCQRIRVPTVVGFLLTGLLAGPHGFGLISAIHEVEIMAEIGVVLLLFTIGVEFSLKEFVRMRKFVLLGGSLQVIFTFLVTYLCTTKLGLPSNQAVFTGFIFALSSTAIVLKTLQEKAEFDSPHGRMSLAVLIFQDVIVVPMVLFTPLLAGQTAQLAQSLAILAAKAGIVIVIVALGARWIVPQVLYQIARSRSRELFLLSVLVICFGVAWLTYRAGLSLALGAFLAGLIISESDYGHQALGNVLPFRDVFTSLFFVSIGMLLNLDFLIAQPGQVIGATSAVMVIKSILTCLAVLVLGFPLRTAIISGITLCQVGEFSFILATLGGNYGLLSGKNFQLVLAISVLTMGVTPVVMTLAKSVAHGFMRIPLPNKLKVGFAASAQQKDGVPKEKLRDHIIVVGFGLNGKNVSRAAKKAAIPYMIIEMNPDTVRQEKKRGEHILYGDATSEAVLEYAGIKEARVLVVAISDPAATRRTAGTARTLNPKLHIIARTRFFQEIDPLRKLGADEVISEEYETSVEIFARVLAKYLVPKEEIDQFTAETRRAGYQMLRQPAQESATLADLKRTFPDMEISSIRVNKQAPIIEKSLAELQLRTKYGVTLLAIRRGPQILANPDGQTHIRGDDILVLLGSPVNLLSVAGSCLECDD
jgi:CPA2 family monovalent cation:H+ antiporter-2